MRLQRFLAASDVFGPDARRPLWRWVQAESRSASVGGAGTLSTFTATLGRLYLDQGHLGEAEKIFERVLAANPACLDTSLVSICRLCLMAMIPMHTS